MWNGEDHVLLNFREHRTDIMSRDAHACPRCHRMTYFFTNRNGQTACTDCQRGEES